MTNVWLRIYFPRMRIEEIRSENILWSFQPPDIAITVPIMGNRPPLEVVTRDGSCVQPNITHVAPHPGFSVRTDSHARLLPHQIPTRCQSTGRAKEGTRR